MKPGILHAVGSVRDSKRHRPRLVLRVSWVLPSPGFQIVDGSHQPSTDRIARTDAICSEERVEDWREEVLETSSPRPRASLESLGGQPVVNHAVSDPTGVLGNIWERYAARLMRRVNETSDSLSEGGLATRSSRRAVSQPTSAPAALRWAPVARVMRRRPGFEPGLEVLQISQGSLSC